MVDRWCVDCDAFVSEEHVCSSSAAARKRTAWAAGDVGDNEEVRMETLRGIVTRVMRATEVWNLRYPENSAEPEWAEEMAIAYYQAITFPSPVPCLAIQQLTRLTDFTRRVPIGLVRNVFGPFSAVALLGEEAVNLDDDSNDN